jgi:hypothetical protein
VKKKVVFVFNQSTLGCCTHCILLLKFSAQHGLSLLGCTQLCLPSHICTIRTCAITVCTGVT